ncbi:MAG: hypothetical protein HC804_07250, partial [Anaerolineae bacterium]|nr:hypothetical protein [Anaerolineae bacterium]
TIIKYGREFPQTRPYTPTTHPVTFPPHFNGRSDVNRTIVTMTFLLLARDVNCFKLFAS